MADVIKGEMIRGQIDTVILLALVDGDKDSNDIRDAIEEKSGNQYSIKQGTFYSAMQRLVKQGLIKEYRTSALDGIRRKYYSLLPKGSKFLEKNREQWSVSKALVDNLINADPTISEPKLEKTQTKTVDEFDTFKALVENADNNFTLESESTTDESYFEVLGASVLSDLNEELSKIESEPEHEIEVSDQPLPQIEPEITEKIEDNSSDYINDYSSLSNKTKEELFSFEINDDDDFETLPSLEDAIVESKENQIEEQPIDETTKDEEPNTIVLQESPSEEDDMLIVEEYTPTNRNKYKQILNSILPKETKKEAQAEQIKEDSKFEQVNFESYEKESKQNSYDASQEQRAIQLEQLRSESIEDKIEEKSERKFINGDPSDFSDLYAMANREGFKIRTSHNTNKFIGNGILINKLRMESSILFFLLIFFEALVLNFALSSILDWKPAVKFIILGCLAIFPIISLIMYLLSPKHLIDEVSQFKDAMCVALIITFQMAIIILCVALFVSVDFNNFKEVTSYILLPFVLALNIPIYFILKYSLLSTGKYFTE